MEKNLILTEKYYRFVKTFKQNGFLAKKLHKNIGVVCVNMIFCDIAKLLCPTIETAQHLGAGSFHKHSIEQNFSNVTNMLQWIKNYAMTTKNGTKRSL